MEGSATGKTRKPQERTEQRHQLLFSSSESKPRGLRGCVDVCARTCPTCTQLYSSGVVNVSPEGYKKTHKLSYANFTYYSDTVDVTLVFISFNASTAVRTLMEDSAFPRARWMKGFMKRA